MKKQIVPAVKKPPRYVVLTKNNLGIVSCVHDVKASFRRKQANELSRVASNLTEYVGNEFIVVSEKAFRMAKNIAELTIKISA